MSNFYQDNYTEKGIELNDIELTKISEFQTKMDEVNQLVQQKSTNKDSGISASDAKQLRTFLAGVTSGYATKKEAAVTTKNVIDAAKQSASMIKNVINGVDVASNAVQATLSIGGALIGSIIPPPYGPLVTSILGAVSSILGIVGEKREPSLTEQIRDLLKEFTYSGLQAGYDTQMAKIKQIKSVIIEDLGCTDLPNRTEVTMQYAIDLVNDKFEITLMSWYKSNAFSASFYADSKWQNKSTALAQSKIIGLTYEYICTKKIWLQLLVALLERTKAMMQAKKMPSEKIVSIDEHLHNVQTAFKGLDDTLYSLVKDIFGKAATKENAVLYAALHAVQSFGDMKRAYKKLAGKDPTYPQPTSGTWVMIKSKDWGPLGQQYIDTQDRKKVSDFLGAYTANACVFGLNEDEKYSGCFNLQGHQGFLPGTYWEYSGDGNDTSSGLKQTGKAHPDADTQRFIFIGLMDDAGKPWYLITALAFVMDKSTQLKTFIRLGLSTVETDDVRRKLVQAGLSSDYHICRVSDFSTDGDPGDHGHFTITTSG